MPNTKVTNESFSLPDKYMAVINKWWQLFFLQVVMSKHFISIQHPS